MGQKNGLLLLTDDMINYCFFLYSYSCSSVVSQLANVLEIDLGLVKVWLHLKTSFPSHWFSLEPNTTCLV